MRGRIAFVAFATIPLTGLAAAPPTCPTIISSASSTAGSSVYYMNGDQPAALSDSAMLEGKVRQPITLYYVVRSTSPERSGVIVIKTARLGIPLKDDDPRFGRVALQRPEGGKRCDRDEVQSPFADSVSTKAYSEYHDRGYDKGGSLEALDGDDRQSKAKHVLWKFHTSYRTIDGKCRTTDDKADANGLYEARSNRSQFSFDTDTVDYGYRGAVYTIAATKISVVWNIIFPSAVAAPGDRLGERRVEIRRYHTINGYACIPFVIQVRGPRQVLRVVDLEARTAEDVRAVELRLGPTIGAAP